MKINQIASVLNSAFFPESTGTAEYETIKEDLSNVVSVGTKITSESTFADMMNGYIKTIYDKVGETIYTDEGYNSGSFDLSVTDAEYGSILEKVRVEAPDFDDNKMWTFTENGGSSHAEMFGYHPIETTAKYFNTRTTFRTKPYTITETQFRSAFTSRQAVIRFISAIEQRVLSKRNLAKNILNHKAVTALIAEKLKTGNNVYDVLAEYITETGDTSVTATNWRTHEKFLVYANTFIRTIVDLMNEPTALYNEEGYISQTTENQRRFYLISDFSRALESWVYRTSFNEEYNKLTGYKTIAYWQSVGNSKSSANYSARSSINAIPPSEGEAPAEGEEDTRKVIKRDNIIGVVFNKWGAVVNAERLETGVQPNNFDKWSNYVHMFGAGYFVDTGENAVVFVIGDGVPPTAKFSVEYKNIVKAGTFDISTLLAYTPNDATVTYESANEETATVDDDGVVTAVEVGATTVIATVTNSDGTTATATIIINVTSE